MVKRFTYPTTAFNCQLASHQCSAETIHGNRCRRRAVIGNELCWTHLLTVKHLRITQSTIPNSGKGLFAMDRRKAVGDIVFKKGDMIIAYGGQDIDLAQLNQRYGQNTAPYGVQKKRLASYSDAACVRSIGSNANTNVGQNNARLGIGQGGVIKLYATKPIRNGDEIWVAYGGSYRFVDHETR